MNINCLQERLIMDDLVIVKGHAYFGRHYIKML